jgi:hypothetical protein
MCWSRTSFPGQALPHRPMPILPLSDWTGPRTCTALHPPHPGVHLDPPSCQGTVLSHGGGGTVVERTHMATLWLVGAKAWALLTGQPFKEPREPCAAVRPTLAWRV